MNNFLIPANSKKSQLIFNFFTVTDLIVFSIGALFTKILLVAFETNNIYVILLECTPLLISGFLVMPIIHYHNVMTFLGNIFAFFFNQRMYKWKGWCVKDAYGREDKWDQQ